MKTKFALLAVLAAILMATVAPVKASPQPELVTCRVQGVWYLYSAIPSPDGEWHISKQPTAVVAEPHVITIWRATIIDKLAWLAVTYNGQLYYARPSSAAGCDQYTILQWRGR